MLKYLVILSVVLFSCCGKHPSLKKEKGIDTSHQNVLKDKEEEKDSIFYLGDFRFEANRTMKIDFIDNKHPKKKIESKGDTLYSDKEYTILGDLKKIKGEGVYRKYKSRLKFSNFDVPNIYKGKPAEPNFKSNPDALYYRTMIRMGCKGIGVNFAGHYTLCEWGCGAECRSLAIIDRINGKIFNAPFDSMDGHYGVLYNPNSKMIVVNSFLLSDDNKYYLCDNWRKLVIYIFENEKFKRIE